MFNLRRAKHVEVETHKQAMFRNYRDTDDVRGVICGDCEIKQAARLFYDNRPQGAMFWGKDDREIEAKAEELVRKMSAESSFCYQDKKLWELRVYD